MEILLVLASFATNLVFALGAIYAAIQMHTLLLLAVMRWPMETFDQTPIGRILNRFSKEIDVVDVGLPLNIRSWLTQFFSVISRQNFSLGKALVASKRRVDFINCLLVDEGKLLHFCAPCFFIGYSHHRFSRHATKIDYYWTRQHLIKSAGRFFVICFISTMRDFCCPGKFATQCFQLKSFSLN